MDTNILAVFDGLKEIAQSVKTVDTSRLERAKARLEELFASFDLISKFLDYIITSTDQIDDLQTVLGLACINRIVKTNLASVQGNDQGSIESFKGFLLQLIQLYCNCSSPRIKTEIKQFVVSLLSLQNDRPGRS